MARTLIEYVLPEEGPEEDFIDFYAQFNVLTAPAAFAVSYYRNRDIRWAFIHAFLAPPYLAYVLVDTVAKKETERLVETTDDLEREVEETLLHAVVRR